MHFGSGGASAGAGGGNSDGQWTHDKFAHRQQRSEQRAQWEAKKAAAITTAGGGEKDAKADEADAEAEAKNADTSETTKPKNERPAEDEEQQAALDV